MVTMLCSCFHPGDGEECEQLIEEEKVLDTSAWMHKAAHFIRDKHIQEVMIPGTHNSGSFAISSSSRYAGDVPALAKYNIRWPVSNIVSSWSKCQSKNIAAQLRDGIRYLDIRVCMRQGKFWTCHGMYGASVTEVLDDVLHFITEFRHEIVILDFNHFYGMDAQNHTSLLALLQNTFEGNIWPAHMADYTLNQAWESPDCGSVIIIYHDVSVANTPFWPGDIGERNEFGCDSRSLICSPWPNVDKLGLLKEKIEYPSIVLEYDLFDVVRHTLHHHKSRCHKIFVTQGILTPGLDTIRAGLLPGKVSSIGRMSGIFITLYGISVPT